MSDLHVVLGTGPIGQRTAEALVAQGVRVRSVNRSGARGEFLPAEVEVVSVADASDASQLAGVVEGAAVVYQCLNPPYDKWPELFPPLQRAAVSAAAKAGARLVVMENLYGLGRVTGPMTEETPLAPNSRKGEVRSHMTEELLAASARGDLEIAIGRASDYYGPGALNSAVGMVFPALVAGKKVSMIGSVDQPHSYAYVEDIGRGLATLGLHAEAVGQIFNLPHAPARTARESLAPAFAAAGRPERICVMSPIVLRIGGLFIPAARESIEMVYEFDEPFVVDSGKIERAFGLTPTPLDEGMRRSAEWFAAHA
jgi:nucleoside-diphosphate-sugar epimerase